MTRSQRRAANADGGGRRAPSIHYAYEENRASLRVDFDSSANEIVIAAGYHGMARFAEVWSMWAGSPSSFDDEHWSRVLSPEYGLDLILNGRMDDQEPR